MFVFERFPASDRHGGLLHWDQLGQFAEVLGDGGQGELVTGAARSS